MRVPRARHVLLAVLAIGSTLLGTASVATPYVVSHISMEPSISPGDIVLVDTAGLQLSGLNRGDLVVFRPPVASDLGAPFIKRVIGLPGETVEISRGVVHIDGRRLVEPYARGATTVEGDTATAWRVPPGSVFLLGDNRANSWDSRGYGPVSMSDILGRAWLSYGQRTSVTLLAGSDLATLLPEGRDMPVAHRSR